jgi:hypothetical protein
MKSKTSNGKYSPNKARRRDTNKLSKMIHNNEKYMNVPHGPLSNKSSSVLFEGGKNVDRNKIYSLRSSNPVIIPTRITDIPA